MTLPTYAEWIADTKRTGRWRSSALEKVDAALLVYAGDTGKKVKPNRSRENLLKLDKLLSDWVATKGGGDGLTTIRNHRGMVDRLYKEVKRLKVTNGASAFLPPGVASHAVTIIKARQQAIDLNCVDCKVATHQRLVYPPGVMEPGAKTMDFEWETVFTLTERRKTLEVVVRIKPTIATALGGDARNFRGTWNTHVASAWKGAKLRVGTDLLDIDCRLDFVDNSFPGDCYEVDVANPPPPPIPPDWKARVAKQKEVTVGGEVGTPHMGQWGASDRAAVAHEFGHMLGCPDEYYTTEYQHMAMPGGIYNQVPFTTDSLMNNTGPRGRIFPRHYSVIKSQYEQWLGLPDGSTEVIVKG